MSGLGKMLLIIGALIAIAGLVLIVAGRFNLPIGRLPGDITYKTKNTTFYFPLATSIILSVVISAVLWFINRR